MNRCLRGNIMECQPILRFRHNFCGDLARDNFFEKGHGWGGVEKGVIESKNAMDCFLRGERGGA
jgi:hypothetical protein